MQINRIGYQPNFQAKFIKNSTIMKFTRDEINEGRDEELIKTMNKLNRHHSNVALLLTQKSDNTHSITNLYNNKSIEIKNLDADKLDSLNDINSFNYKHLFIGEKVIKPAKTEKIAKQIADKYFLEAAPDYELGHNLDKTTI